MAPEGVEPLAASLEVTDRVALEVSGGAWEVARILEPHVERVVVVSPDDSGIAQARTKTDRLDAGALASLLWRGELEAVWMPDERARVVRRRLASLRAAGRHPHAGQERGARGLDAPA